MPLIVTVLEPKETVTPGGNPDVGPKPVAPVVACVMAGDNGVLIHSVGVDDAGPAVFNAIVTETG